MTKYFVSNHFCIGNLFNSIGLTLTGDISVHCCEQIKYAGPKSPETFWKT